MSNVLLTTDGSTAETNFLIPQVAPGIELVDQTLRLIFSGNQALPITLSITAASAGAFTAGAIAGAFTAQLDNFELRTEKSTPVAGVGPLASVGPNGTLTPNGTYHFDIYFVAPSTLVPPGPLIATLTVTGADGSVLASVVLWGQTAQIVATTAVSDISLPPVAFDQNALGANIVYVSRDTSPLSLVLRTIGLPTGLTGPTVYTSLPVTWMTIDNPRAPWLRGRIPSFQRSATIPVFINSDETWDTRTGQPKFRLTLRISRSSNPPLVNFTYRLGA